MNTSHVPEQTNREPATPHLGRRKATGMGLTFCAVAFANSIGCDGLQPQGSETAEAETGQGIALTTNSPRDGLVNIYAPSYQGSSSGFVCAESAGQAPLVANRSALGVWEQYILAGSTDGTYSIQSLANMKYVSTPLNGPLIANATAVSNTEKWYISGTYPDQYNLWSKATGYSWVTGWDRTVYAAGTRYSNLYRILRNKIPGHSANVITDRSYSWNYIYLQEHLCCSHPAPGSPQRSGMEYSFNLSNGGPATLYIDGQRQGKKVCGPREGYYPHAVRVECSGPCTLNDFSFDIPTETCR